MDRFTPHEIARDVATLWQILPGRSNHSRRALREIERHLAADPPRPGAALAQAMDALDGPERHDHAERAVLEAVGRLLLPATWVRHTGTTCPVPPGTLVQADLDGDVITDRAGELFWGEGLGEDGAGRIVAFRIVEP